MAVLEHRARAALAEVAAFLGSREAQVFAQDQEQGAMIRNGDVDALAVDLQRELRQRVRSGATRSSAVGSLPIPRMATPAPTRPTAVTPAPVTPVRNDRREGDCGSAGFVASSLSMVDLPCNGGARDNVRLPAIPIVIRAERVGPIVPVTIAFS
jgi:hypothetical protein